MYQRIPYSTLENIREKQPQSYAFLKLPPNPNDREAFAEWEKTNRATTTTYDDACRYSAVDFKDHTFAKWQTRTFPKGLELEGALERIELSNTIEARVLKYKLTFNDGCHILLTRSDPANPNTLRCTEYYNPNAIFDQNTARRKKVAAASPAAKRRHQFIVDPHGHLNSRKRAGDGEPMHNSFGFPPAVCGKMGFTFTPVSYISHAVKPNINLPGVRPGLKETSKEAYQYLRKQELLGSLANI